MTQTHLANERSTRHPNQVIIVANGIAAARHQVDVTKNRHVAAAQAAAVIVAVIRVIQIHVIRIGRESTQDATGHRLTMTALASRAKAAVTNVINTQEKKATLEVIATKEVDTKFY